MEKVVAFMPIRLNSTRIKNKSVVEILGRPMFCWSLETLDQLNIPVYVYTNEETQLRSKIDFETKNVIFMKRPRYLDDHSTKGIDIYKEFSKQVKSEIYLLSHCTSPFVKRDTYEKCIDAVKFGGHNSSLTVKKEQTFVWYQKSRLNFSLPRPKTQEITPVLVETSAAYCYRANVLNSGSRSCDQPNLILTNGIETIDIDEMNDLELIRRLK